MPPYRIPIVTTLIDAARLCFGNFGVFSLRLAISVAMMAATVVYWRSQATAGPSPMQLLVPLWWAIWFTLFAITCHRLALLGPDGTAVLGHVTWGRREFVFFWRLLILMVGVPIVAATVLLLALGGVVPDLPTRMQDAQFFSRLGLAVFLAAAYFIARWSLVFPAVATDEPIDFAESWARSRGNGWRLAIIVGIIPAAVEIARVMSLRAEPSVVELAINALLGYALLAVQVVALSLAYRDLRRAPVEQTADRAM